MGVKAFKTSIYSVVIVFVLSLFTTHSVAQSQAINGQIEGTLFDKNGAVIPNASVSATNIENGAARAVFSDRSGFYRFPLLPLGTYRLEVDILGFKRHVREGISLVAGQTATVDIELETGEITQEIRVSLNSPVADAGKTSLGRVMNSRELQSLPLISRNPYNFGVLQANVNGRPARGFAFPNLNANGFARRVSYQLDGMTNTQSDRAGVRLMLISETQVNEVQLVTNGFAPEFGNTPGMIMNVVTPSGTNRLSGMVSLRFRRPSFYSRPFFYPWNEPLPDNKTNDIAAAVGAPIIKDRLHVYLGYEFLNRDNKATADQLITISDVNKTALMAAGLPASIFPAAIPSRDVASFSIVRSDFDVNKQNRLALRINAFDINTKNFIIGGLNTLERSVDTISRGYSLGAQLVTYYSNILNEFRFQYAQRKTITLRNEVSGSGPSITFSTNIANFGAPDNADTVNPFERVSQIQNNLTWTRGAHEFKFGGGINFISDFKRSAVFTRYTFPNVAAYVEARNGIDQQSRQTYARYDETFGDPETRYHSTFWNLFAQDDWKPAQRLKFNYGIRYDLYVVPKADVSSPFVASRDFHIDKDNFAPRLGLVYVLQAGSRPLLIRAGLGIYFESPWLNLYERALLRNGSPKFISYRFLGNNNHTQQAGPNAPLFPNSFAGRLPAGSTLPAQDVDSIAPDFENMYAIHSDLQIEKALTSDLSVALSYVHTAGRHIPVYRNINLGNPVGYLADGRGIFDPSRRNDPRFNVIQMAESSGVSQYDAIALQLSQRFSHGMQFNAHYSLSSAIDDAPEQNLSTGNIQGLVISDPYDRHFDWGNSLSDQRHTFAVSFVAIPNFKIRNEWLRALVNHNQVSILSTANSGERFNIVARTDLNHDGIFGAGVTNSDRPIGIGRNSGKTPAQFDLDIRYSRLFHFFERADLEIFAEVQNLLNINSIVSYIDVSVSTNSSGELLGPLPDFRRLSNNLVSQDSRQFQLGTKISF